MTGLDIVGLLRDYGGWGLSTLLILAVIYLQKARDADAERATKRYDGAVERYQKQLEDLVGKVILAIERSSVTTASVSTALESRTGIFERLSEAVEAAKSESKALIADLKHHAVSNDQWTREKLDATLQRIETILGRIDDLRREVAR